MISLIFKGFNTCNADFLPAYSILELKLFLLLCLYSQIGAGCGQEFFDVIFSFFQIDKFQLHLFFVFQTGVSFALLFGIFFSFTISTLSFTSVFSLFLGLLILLNQDLLLSLFARDKTPNLFFSRKLPDTCAGDDV